MSSLEDQLAAPSRALKDAKEFLRYYVHDSDMRLLEIDVGGMIEINPNPIIDAVEAIEELLAVPQEPGTLFEIVTCEGNRMLDDETDETAAVWLKDLVKCLRTWLGEHAPLPRAGQA